MAHQPWRHVVAAFPSPLLQFLFTIVEHIFRPFIYCLTGAAGPFIPTTLELKNPTYLTVQKLLFTPIYAVLIAILLCPVLVAFVIRNILHQFRHPFCLSVVEKAAVAPPKETYSVATGNLCLLPEIFSKYNNLFNTKQRAIEIGQRMVTDHMYYTDMVRSLQKRSEHFVHSSFCNGIMQDRIQTRSSVKKENIRTKSGLKMDVITHFPQTDFLCLQETFERDFSKLLVAELHKVYPYIVYDVGYNSPRLNYCGLNSGLMFASRYEILDIQFKPFSEKCGFCTIVGKGLLMVKVCLGKNGQGGQDVGYVFNTHLQAFQGLSLMLSSNTSIMKQVPSTCRVSDKYTGCLLPGDNPVVVHQLSEILEWSSEFKANSVAKEDNVLFDMLCGDFNIDNMSPGEVHIADHDLFETYVDVCRERPGKDYDWTVGTELRTPLLHDKAISTPEDLKAAIEDPYLRQYYLIDADLEKATMDSIYNAPSKKDAQGNLILSPVGGRRRIDLVLYRKDSAVVVENINIITRLAPLTDHIPVSATFTCVS